MPANRPLTCPAHEVVAILDGRQPPVLFLDIDGVLNSRACWERLRGHRHKIDREKVALLNRVVAATGCQIVVSSTWRKGIGQGKGGCRSILRDYGLKARFRRDWRTPEFGWDGPAYPVRGTEIADWLRRNGNPPYVIVDDDSDMLPEQMPRFVQTTFADGLTPAHADRLIALLSLPAVEVAPEGVSGETGEVVS